MVNIVEILDRTIDVKQLREYVNDLDCCGITIKGILRDIKDMELEICPIR